jgi:signal recognition particle subunit SRP54
MFDFLSKKFSSLFSGITGQSQLTGETIDQVMSTVTDSLLEADVPYDVAQAFVQEVKEGVSGKKLEAKLKAEEFLTKVVYDKLLGFLGGQSSDSVFTFQIPSVVMVMGLQGSGKTTSVAKLAHFIVTSAHKRGKKRKVLVASVDFYRPAAIDQLQILAKRAGIDFYRARSADPVAAAQEIYAHSTNNRYEILLLDTAGRLHVDDLMLKELQAIDTHLQPKYKLMVLDSMTGQESLNVAKSFEQVVGFSGAVLTKMDSDTRGGAAFSFRYALKKPVLFVGAGEKLEDFEQFRPERIAQRMLGMGDILTLVERANDKIKQGEQDKMYGSMAQGRFTLEDFASQIDMVNKLGSLSTIMKYLPGGMGAQVSPEMLEKGEVEVKKFKAIISSMTRKERLLPKVLDDSRKKRIAQGSGSLVSDVDSLLQRFKQSQQMLKGFKQNGGFNRFFR